MHFLHALVIQIFGQETIVNLVRENKQSLFEFIGSPTIWEDFLSVPISQNFFSVLFQERRKCFSAIGVFGTHTHCF